MATHDWSTARELLAQRLDLVSTLGRKRLNLYLLSVVANASGHTETGLQLAQLARSTPIELSEPRYLGSSEDDLHRELEQGWWAFNGWNVDPTLAAIPTASPSSELPWADILDSVVEGRAGELERRWSAVLEGEHPERAILWNLVALAYLEQGDPRTYDEMREQAPSAGPAPEVLLELLRSANLHGAAEAVAEGRWLTSESLQVDETLLERSRTASRPWTEGMEEAFSFLAVGRADEAARKFGPLCEPPYAESERGYALRGLSLALVGAGEYTAAQEADEDSAALLATAPDPVLDELFRGWRESLHPEGTHSNGLSGGELSFDADSDSELYWGLLKDSLEALSRKDISEAKLSLRRLLGVPLTSGEPTHGFLVSLLFAATAILEGDTIEAQDSIAEAVRQAETGPLVAETLQQAQELFQHVGATTVAGKLSLEGLSSLDPWRDFPADF